jgi:transcriptional regulator with XRE-family HTH domain
MAGRGDLPPSGFGSALRRTREGKGLTQKQLAETAGLHPNTVAKLERGDQEPNWPLVLQLAGVLGVTCQDFTGAVPPASEPEPPASGPGKRGGAKGKGKTG